MKTIASVAVLTLLLATTVVADDSLRQLLGDLQIAESRIASPSPFTLPDLDGKAVSLASLGGRPALLYFWATW